MIQVGTLVKYKADGGIGLITGVMKDPRHGVYWYWIKWVDGTECDHLSSEFEVIA